MRGFLASMAIMSQETIICVMASLLYLKLASILLIKEMNIQSDTTSPVDKELTTCADPESFVRGGPQLCQRFFFSLSLFGRLEEM